MEPPASMVNLWPISLGSLRYVRGMRGSAMGLAILRLSHDSRLVMAMVINILWRGQHVQNKGEGE